MTFHPLLRIAHISDVHFVPLNQQHGGPLHDAAVRLAFHPGALAKPAQFLSSHLGQGSAGHDPKALWWLRRSLLFYLRRDERWKGRSYVALTGDLSTWGDTRSTYAVLGFLDNVAEVTNSEPLVVYGNHDVWPGEVGTLRGMPIAHTDDELARRRSRMRQQYFRNDFPGFAAWTLRSFEPIRIPATDANFTVVGFNSVLHERGPNSVASGRIAEDWYWDKRKTQSQLTIAAERLKSVSCAVILTHHPIWDPSGWSGGGHDTPYVRAGMAPPFHALYNAREVAQSVGVPVHGAPPVRIFLSGHTHVVYPPPAELPPQSLASDAGTLCANQVQLTIGSAAQERFIPTASPSRSQRNSWQLIHLFFDDERSELLLERFVFIRANDTGNFRLLGSSEGSAEHMRFPLPLPKGS
jgi:predicted MPP superfamily phosphohydrolase